MENAYGPLSRVRVVAAITDLITAVRRPHPIRVAIDGVDAAGKTTLADELATVIERRGRPVIRASIDGFHNPRAIRYRRGPISPEGYFLDSFNYPALREALLQPLGPGGSRAFRRAVFDVRRDEPVATPLEVASDDAVLLLDGVFLLREELREHFDFSVFVHADFAETLRRAEQRDLALFGTVDEIRRRYQERYVPGQRLYLDSAQPERHASVVVDNNDPSAPRIAPSSRGLFVIVSGLPGSGKTTAGRALAGMLGLPLIDKDNILEELFTAKGTGDAAWRRALSRESDRLLQQRATSTRAAIVVSFWHCPGMPEDSGTPTAWLSGLSSRLVHLRCQCPPAVAAARFRERRRHEGHLDFGRDYADVLRSLETLERLPPLSLEPSIAVDTSVAPDWREVAYRIEAIDRVTAR